jgi:energy-coupling factor transport system permease protein
MEDYRFIQYLTTGQVIPTESVIHRLDPRTRLLGFAGMLVVFVAAPSIDSIALALAATAGLVLLARVPARYALKGLQTVLPWLFVMAALQVAFGIGDKSACTTLVRVGPVRVTWCTLEFAIITFLRVLGFILLMELLAWTSSITGLVHGVEALAMPLDRLGLPAHDLAMVGTIAIRFVPTMAMEAERLLKAQTARGADLQHGKLGMIGRIRRMLPLLVPLFALALRRAERLAEAMDARAYTGGRGRGSYVQLRMRWADRLALGVILLFVLAVLFLG